MNHPDRVGASHGSPARSVPLAPMVSPVGSFADLELPAEVLRTLTERGVREPFPIQAATLPLPSQDATSWGAGARGRARRSPSAYRCSYGRPGGARSRSSRSP